MFDKIKKRNGDLVDFDASKITIAVKKALRATGIPAGSEDKIAQQVTDSAIGLLNGETVPTVEQTQDAVERALIELNYADTAKAYILYRQKRQFVRDSGSMLNEQLHELFDQSAQESDLKRDNANVDGDCAMGTMLQVGAAASKSFYAENFLTEEQKRANQSGDIHIHDFDFYALTETCVTADTMLNIRTPEDGYIYVRASWFDKYYGKVFNKTGVHKLDKAGITILSGEKGYVKMLNVSRRLPAACEKVYRIEAGEKSFLECTSTHKVPVMRDGEKIVIPAEYIYEGDFLFDGGSLKPIPVTGKKEIEYHGYVYDFETEDHFFVANDILVHNCCQIDIKKLFEHGFSTGHGFLREPQSIRSYAALACIAIQANQNDQHGGQSIPNFDYGMADGVRKTYAKEFATELTSLYEDMMDFEPGKAKKSIEDAIKSTSMRPTMESHTLFDETLLEKLVAMTSAHMKSDLRKIICRAHKRALAKTDKATHQAMESVVHNLNSMHSRAGKLDCRASVKAVA